MKTIKTTFLLVIGFLIVSCESNTYSEIAGAKVAQPTYEANIKPMMSTYCTSCHSVTGDEPSTPLETYDQVVARAETISCRIDGKSCELMPASGRIPQSQIDMFNLWMTQGYVEK